MAKSYALSKKKVRETILEKFNQNDEVKVSDILALFESAGRAVGETTLVYDEEGNVVGRKCSYFGKYLPINQFGTMGTDEDGNPKYAYQSKPAQKLIREHKKQVAEMAAKIEAELEETGDVDAWREAKSELAEFEAQKADCPEDVPCYDTAEELLEAVA